MTVSKVPAQPLAAGGHDMAKKNPQPAPNPGGGGKWQRWLSQPFFDSLCQWPVSRAPGGSSVACLEVCSRRDRQWNIPLGGIPPPFWVVTGGPCRDRPERLDTRLPTTAGAALTSFS